MATYNIQITKPAEDDLTSIGRYISKELLEPETARKAIAGIADSIKTLVDLPLRNDLVNDERLAEIGIRKILETTGRFFQNLPEGDSPHLR